MFDECDVVAVLHILEPGQAVGVGCFTGDNILIAIAVDIVSIYLGAASVSKLERMSRPETGLTDFRRLFPPAIFLKNICAAVAVNITDPQSVCESTVFEIGRNRMKLPGRSRIFPRAGVPELASGMKDQLWFPIPGQVGIGGRFIIDVGMCQMLFPVPLFVLRIRVPECFFPRKTDNHNVGPLVFVDITSEGEKVIGITVDTPFLDRIEFMPFLKFRPLVPVWPRDDIRFSILIEIGECGSFCVEFVSQLLAFKLMDNELFGGRERRCRQE